MYSPLTYTNDLPFKYKARYTTSHFNTVIDSQQTDSTSGPSSTFTPTAAANNYSPNVWDPITLVFLGIVARPLILPMTLINQLGALGPDPQVY